jgi:hypothetical protein
LESAASCSNRTGGSISSRRLAIILHQNSGLPIT